MKIVITGGLGYIGTELCKLYSKEKKKHKITVLDNRFISSSVAQLKKQGIKFVHGDILDKEIVLKVVSDADIVHHFAGITDVAYVSSEANAELDRKITSAGVEGSRNIMASIKKDAKIIFPSSHVVFEGLKEPVLDIEESYQTCPVLAYAKGKVETEKDLASSSLNYVILRLGSNYGLGGPTMRMNIMPNIFARIASQNGTIKLFGGGVQYKSLVDVRDAARFMKFTAESKKISRETFHVVSENTTVKGVADLCKQINKKVSIVPTSDEVPNKGYTMSNRKLLATGFKFKHKLKDSLEEMIQSWMST